MTFRNRPFSARYAEMGDRAEKRFEAEQQRGFVRYGLSRPPLRLASIPPFIRFTPDYLTSTALVEVQGFGRDQTFKLKRDKLAALGRWADEFPVDFFIYDSHNDRHTVLSLTEVEGLCARYSTLQRFPEGHLYFAVPAERIFHAP